MTQLGRRWRTELKLSCGRPAAVELSSGTAVELAPPSKASLSPRWREDSLCWGFFFLFKGFYSDLFVWGFYQNFFVGYFPYKFLKFIYILFWQTSKLYFDLVMLRFVCIKDFLYQEKFSLRMIFSYFFVGVIILQKLSIVKKFLSRKVGRFVLWFRKMKTFTQNNWKVTKSYLANVDVFKILHTK